VVVGVENRLMSDPLKLKKIFLKFLKVTSAAPEGFNRRPEQVFN